MKGEDRRLGRRVNQGIERPPDERKDRAVVPGRPVRVARLIAGIANDEAAVAPGMAVKQRFGLKSRSGVRAECSPLAVPRRR